MAEATETPNVPPLDMKLEVVVIPVADVDRAKSFYAGLGWRLDADFAARDGWRVVQFTPPGSGCSVIFGQNVTAAAPGSAQGLYLIVAESRPPAGSCGSRHRGRRGVPRRRRRACRPRRALSVRAHPGERSGCGAPQLPLLRLVRDPDGNGWLLQEVTARLPGRVDASATTFASPAELAGALRRAAAAHGEHERRSGGQHDANWPDWYALHMVREQAGDEPPP